jgi:sucrose-6-phosphate hydrolase SacC (GH32 family)
MHAVIICTACARNSVLAIKPPLPMVSDTWHAPATLLLQGVSPFHFIRGLDRCLILVPFPHPPLQGRQLLWGWIQEHRRVPPPPCECADYDYAGCLSTPRVLFSRGGRLHQAPLPELALLRSR